MNKSFIFEGDAYADHYTVEGSILNITLVIEEVGENIQYLSSMCLDISSLINPTVYIDLAVSDFPDLSFDIIKPENALYISDNKIIPFFKPIIFGDITIEINFTSESDWVSWAKLYVDNEFKCYISPYNSSCLLEEKLFAKHEILISATDINNNTINKKLDVWKFF
jgi:hypothetical protein